MLHPDDAQIVLERGARAKALMESEIFIEAFRDLEYQHTCAMIAAMPTAQERDAREYHHQQIHSLRELASTLALYAQAGDEITESLADEADDDI